MKANKKEEGFEVCDRTKVRVVTLEVVNNQSSFWGNRIFRMVLAESRLPSTFILLNIYGN